MEGGEGDLEGGGERGGTEVWWNQGVSGGCEGRLGEWRSES